MMQTPDGGARLELTRFQSPSNGGDHGPEPANDMAKLMFKDPRVRHVGPDADGDRVPDVLEDFVGSETRKPIRRRASSARTRQVSSAA
jgi:hypothetical protein